MKTSTIKDIAREAGVGVATVDRVLNRRAPVRQQTKSKVLAAAQRLGYRFANSTPIAAAQANSSVNIRMGFILLPGDDAFYGSFCEQLQRSAAPWHADDCPPEFCFHTIDAIEETAAKIRELATRVDIIGLVALDNALIRHAVEEVTAKGVKVFALLSDLSPCGHTGYIGLDNRKAGRTAGWAVDKLGNNVGKIAIIIGDNQFTCQETCEISFRSYLRERAGNYQLLEPIRSRESASHGYQATQQLLQQHQDLSVIYAPCGGIEGVVKALKESGRQQQITMICHGPFDQDHLALINGDIDLLINHRLADFAAVIIDTFRQNLPESPAGFINLSCPFELLTAENC